MTTSEHPLPIYTSFVISKLYYCNTAFAGTDNINFFMNRLGRMFVL